jgi:hypothetical protein
MECRPQSQRRRSWKTIIEILNTDTLSVTAFSAVSDLSNDLSWLEAQADAIMVCSVRRPRRANEIVVRVVTERQSVREELGFGKFAEKVPELVDLARAPSPVAVRLRPKFAGVGPRRNRNARRINGSPQKQLYRGSEIGYHARPDREGWLEEALEELGLPSTPAPRLPPPPAREGWPFFGVI